MNAVQFEKAGGSEVIRVLDLPIPAPSRGEVRVKVEACVLNFSDVMIRQGRCVTEVPFPYRVGREFSGSIDTVGDDVGILRKDDEVFGLSFNGGAMTEYVVAEAAAVSPVPRACLLRKRPLCRYKALMRFHVFKITVVCKKEKPWSFTQQPEESVGLPFRLHLLGARRSFVDRGRDLAP